MEALLLPTLMVAALFAVMLPQRRRMRAHQTVQQSISAGVSIMTTSGVYGTVVGVEDDVVRLEIAPGVVIRSAKGAIARIVEPSISEVGA
jgi:preprotein translocase subunit YajC